MTARKRVSRSARVLGRVKTNARTWVTVIISAGIAVATGWASYRNLRSALVMAHTDSLTAALLAAVPDLLMGLSLLGIGAKRPHGTRASLWTWATFGFGLVASVAGNELAEWGHGWVARVVGFVVPLAVMLAVESVRNARKNVRKPVKRMVQIGTVKAPERVVRHRTAKVGTQVLATQ